MLTVLMNRGHSSLCHLLLHHSSIFVIAHLCDSCSTRLLWFGALCPEVAFFATVKTRPVSTTCSVPIDVHGIRVPLRGWNPCWWGRISARPGIGSWRILTSSHKHLIFSPSPVNSDCRVLPVL